MKNPLIQLIIIQFKEFLREPGVLFWSFLFPVLIALGLGMAFNKKNEMKKDVAVIENQVMRNSAFRNILHLYAKIDSINEKIRYSIRTGSEKTGFITFRFMPASWNIAEKMLKQGKVLIILEEKDKKLYYHYDPLNTDAQLTYMQLTSLISEGIPDEPAAEIKPLTQKGTRYIDFLIPGLIAMNMMMSSMWGVSYTLIEKRSKKLMRRMVATPMRKSDFMLAQLVTRFVLCTVEAIILYVFAWYFFSISIEGSILALLVLFLAGMIFFTGLAILISSRTSNTEVGNGLINVVVMPMMILSGIFFSYHNFPDPFVKIIQKLPLTVLADGIRSIFIEGAGFAETYIASIILLTLGLIAFITGLKIYKWY
jgi:ABC-type multidrug transport system permease subunit